jgi:hypothetical protein
MEFIVYVVIAISALVVIWRTTYVLCVSKTKKQSVASPCPVCLKLFPSVHCTGCGQLRCTNCTDQLSRCGRCGYAARAYQQSCWGAQRRFDNFARGVGVFLTMGGVLVASLFCLKLLVHWLLSPL